MLTAAVLVGCMALLAASVQTLAGAADSEGMAPLELPSLPQRSSIVAADGSVLATLYDEDRLVVRLASVPKVLQNAVIAVEDSAFYQHEGLSVPGMARALKNNAQSGRVSQGGSTITQQVMKNDLLTADRTVARKVRETLLAHRMEQQYSKEEILERYLNSVYFGEGAHGAATAAQRYFGKDVSGLTLGEAALLAGQIANPATFSPFRDRERAAARRDHALNRMVSEGFVTDDEADAARKEPLPRTLHKLPAQPEDYFAEEVRRRLMKDERLGATRADRRDAILRGGLTVHTTLDPRLQALAEQAVREELPASDFTASLISIDPADGDVLALVGGRGFEDAKFNLATQGTRQPGSSFKTVALAAALEHSYTTKDRVPTRSPCVFDMPAGQEPWKVRNYDGAAGGGVLTLRDATVKSSNCAFAQLSMHLGPEKIVEMARRLGITRHTVAVPSVALGALEASPLEMAAVNAAVASGGVYHEPLFIRRVEGPDGEVLFENAPVARRAMSHDTALLLTDVLTEVITRGTGRAAAIDRPAAGKTGTSQEWRDAWFNGFTPHLATSVWMGHPAGQISMDAVDGRRVTGGSFPARIWSVFMAPASEPFAAIGFAPPPSEGAGQWIGDAPEPSSARPARDDEDDDDRKGRKKRRDD